MDYLASIEEAIEYIENHLEEVILSEDIAKAAGYSLYHLTHIFTAVIGEDEITTNMVNIKNMYTGEISNFEFSAYHKIFDYIKLSLENLTT